MPTHTFLIRHGQSTFNELFDATGIDPLHHDARLTSKGRHQVVAAKEAAQRLGVDLVVVSPLTRAIDMSRPVRSRTHQHHRVVAA